ncbi:hypothetical protein IGI37_002196 [Enterococcus sp. AZ194]|uniref:DUF2264 domain-containing protein n=1 Tax=Enterococcus sp. AZ194 TaxID=2774629 RepID=UPI003F238D12
MTNLQTQSELVQWLDSMVPCDFTYLDQSGGSYLKEIRHFEGIMRPLWGLIPKYVGQNNLKEIKNEPIFQSFQQLLSDKALPTFSTENRQIAVELNIIGYALGTFGNEFLNLLAPENQTYLLSWLNGINTIEFPAGNWYFFLVLVNGALKKIGAEYSEERLQEALVTIESFYLGEGWYSDGSNQQRDYYVSFAFHFYGLLYGRFAKEDIAKKFQERACLFAMDFRYWFDNKGRSLPFGRSLTYRFAHAAFWSAFIVTDTYKQSDLSLGEVKKILLDHLRYWTQMPITLPKEQNLSIGYGYNNLLLSEDYNAPGSPMWAFKSFVLLELSKTDKFWQVEEQPTKKRALTTQLHAGFFIQTADDQTIALSNKQYANNQHLYHGREKYSKFAYSTAVGFNLTRENQGLESFAIDSTLAFSLLETNQYQTRGLISKSITYSDYSVSQWTVYNKIRVTTYLVPVNNHGHIRIHEIFTPFPVETAEGGFPLLDWNQKYQTAQIKPHSCLLTNHLDCSVIYDLVGDRKPQVTQQGPNTNIYSAEKNGVPTLVKKLCAGKHLFVSYINNTHLANYHSDRNLSFIEKEKFFVIKGEITVKIKKEPF